MLKNPLNHAFRKYRSSSILGHGRVDLLFKKITKIMQVLYSSYDIWFIILSLLAGKLKYSALSELMDKSEYPLSFMDKNHNLFL